MASPPFSLLRYQEKIMAAFLFLFTFGGRHSRRSTDTSSFRWVTNNSGQLVKTASGKYIYAPR